MSDPSFSEVYCGLNGVQPIRFEREVLRLTLYPHARLLAPLCHLFNRGYFAADFELIRSVSGYCQGHHFSGEAVDYRAHPANQSFWRRVLRIRVSVRRLFILIQQTLPAPKSAPAAKASAGPFAVHPPSPSPTFFATAGTVTAVLPPSQPVGPLQGPLSVRSRLETHRS